MGSAQPAIKLANAGVRARPYDLLRDAASSYVQQLCRRRHSTLQCLPLAAKTVVKAMETLPQVEPIYRTVSPNVPVELGTHRIILLNGDQRGTQGDASFTLRMSPAPRLVGSMHVPEAPSSDDIMRAMGDRAANKITVEIPALSARFSILPPQTVINSSGTHITLHPTPEHIEIFRTRPAKLREVVFHIVNFKNFRGSKNDILISPTSPRRIGRVVLKLNGWRVTIQALQETESLVQRLDEEGGFAITHVGKMERVQRGAFDVKEAKALLEVLRLYLSFARGAFVVCPLAVGYDRNDVAWEQWGSHIVYPWRDFPGWFSGRPADPLEEVFPGFAGLFKDPHWKRHLRAVLYWYLRANNTAEGPGVDGGIVLSQAALEKLAWVYLVEYSRAITPQQYSQLGSASKRLATLFSHMNIPTDIPAELQMLTSMAKKHGWNDAPEALTKVRNDLTHAEEKFLTGSDAPFYDAWSLAQRYIELAVLHLAGHAGQYTDRISAEWITQTTKVPWA